MPSSNKMWAMSFTTLGAADVLSAVSTTAPALMGAAIMGSAAGAGLIAISANDLRKATTIEQKLDSGNDLLWGAQGLLYVTSSSSMAAATIGLGVVGATLQTAVGLRRIKHGLASGNRVTAKLGALDVGGGLLWLGWDLLNFVQPIFVGSYVVLMVGREVYANKESVKSVMNNLTAEARQKLVAARDIVANKTAAVTNALELPDGSSRVRQLGTI